MNVFKFKFKVPKVGESLSKVFTDPKIYITLIVVLAVLALLISMKKVKLTTKIMTNVAIAVALSTVLKMFRIMKMPMGGSVTLGCMIPIIFIAYVYGAKVGYIAGMIFGIIDLLLGADVVHPAQLLLDYIFAYSALGVAGYFKDNILLGTAAAISMRFLCHVLSGVIFFSAYAKGQNPLIYSISYNATYLIPEAIISVVVLYLLPIKRVRNELAKEA